MPHSQMAGTLCFFLGIPFLIFLLSGLSEFRRLRRYPQFRAVDGMPARLVGTTRAAIDLRTPFGGDACCWYEAAASVGDTVLSRESSALVPFYVDTAAGEVIVDPLRIIISGKKHRGIWRESSPQDIQFARAQGFDFEKSRNLQLNEYWMPIGTPVTLIGPMGPEPYRESFAAQARNGEAARAAITAPFEDLQGNAPPHLRGFVSSSASSIVRSTEKPAIGGPNLELFVGNAAEIESQTIKQILICSIGIVVMVGVGWILF